MAFSEQTLVEDYIVERLIQKGWNFVPPDELERESYKEPLLTPNLVRAIERINKDYPLTEEEVNKSINELKLLGTGVEGARRLLTLFKFGVPVKFEKDRVLRSIQLFDFSENGFKNNDFIVTRQVNYDGLDRIRTDIVLYINGIPLVSIECKNPTSISESWYTAYKQIKDYEKVVPELYKYIQVGVAAESEARYFPIVQWQDEVSTHLWRSEIPPSPPLSKGGTAEIGKGGFMNSIDSTIEMLTREVLLDIVKNFLFFREETGSPTKVVARYMQYRAANKMVNRVIDNLEGKEQKNKGLVWHWQGSGKTLTMLFAANKLYYDLLLENPSIFFVVDRIELEDQLYKEFYSLDIVAPEIIETISDLKSVLSHDDYRGKRGVFIVLIHKFRPEELKELQKELLEISSKKETIMNRKNIVAFIDEGHRTQYGMLSIQMKAILKNAFFFALTGTPISKKGRDTYTEFSYPPKEPYLDKYFITDSIKDGFTKKIVYQPRLEKEFHLKKELLEGFWEVELEELPENMRDIVEEKVKQKLSPIKLFLENPKRIKAISQDIAEHFKENVNDRFKAIVVAASRKACVLYEKELKKLLPKKYIEVVMTYERKDEQVILDRVAETQAIYGGKDIEDIRKEVVERFKEEENPRILIVTDMLLTGFDAPILQTMYLDKPLKEHRLLQAIARTNRPYKGIKEAGLIIDYVGVLKQFKKALEMYSEDDIAGAIYGYDSLKEEFGNLIKEIQAIFKSLDFDYERETLLKALEIVTSVESNEKKFVEDYINLRKVFELLGTDEIKLEYFEIYKWISAIYTYYMKTVKQKPAYGAQVAKFYQKTIKYVHKSIDIDKIEKELPAISFDEHYLEKLEEKVKSKKEKAADMLFTLNRFVIVERHRNPIYESLVDKVEKLLEMWKEKTKDYERIYKEAVDIIISANTLSERQKSLGFSNMQYSLLLVLEDKLGCKDELIDEVRDLSSSLESQMFAGWLYQTTAKREIERDVRRFARKLKQQYVLSIDEMNELYQNLINSTENYGTN